MTQAETEAPLNIGEMVLHHTADAYSIGMDPLWHVSWPSDLWVLHLGGMTLNMTPTKHVIFMLITATLVFLSLKVAGKKLQQQRAAGQAPRGYANAMEALVLFVRNDIAIANIGHDGHKFVPLILTLFFFVLYANIIGLLPWGAAATGNLAVTGALALMVFLVIEIGGMRKLGFKGYMGTIFPKIPGLGGVGGTVMSIGLAPIELIGKLVKPFALAVRLFGNMTAGHFVILSLFGIIFMFGHLAAWNWVIGLVTAGLVLGIMLLELIVAFLQAYVFALLSSVFIGLMQHEH
jgi:F-type H+-transporting ATPase subunit a